MTPTELSALATQLYGTRWQSALARAIARERRTVNRWATGASPIPKAVVSWLTHRAEAGGRETHPAQGAKAGAGRQGRGVPGVRLQLSPKSAFHEETDPTEGL